MSRSRKAGRCVLRLKTTCARQNWQRGACKGVVGRSTAANVKVVTNMRPSYEVKRLHHHVLGSSSYAGRVQGFAMNKASLPALLDPASSSHRHKYHKSYGPMRCIAPAGTKSPTQLHGPTS
ncbi:hypothetical protein E2C01_034427 [Portunus trituberculatus]|uniref:Uncharacterized protein n=1 Tax=Portunus trituberculatus TaxID=210409 RepID=A0A5B7F8H3_PORTR|nr:hypothetical protein [Portunus trituberculatus]